MSRYIEGQDRQQVTLLPECLDDFIDELDMVAQGCQGAMPAATGRPSYHPAVLLKLYVYGYLNLGVVVWTSGSERVHRSNFTRFQCCKREARNGRPDSRVVQDVVQHVCIVASSA